MKIAKKYWMGIAVSALLLVPFFLWICWVFTPSTKLVIGIIDKTAVNRNMEKHAALNWVLNHEKIAKTTSNLYKNEKDYFGFFPKKREEYAIRGLENKTNEQLQQLSRDCDAAYVTDAYGVYKQEWFRDKNTPNYGMLYGGLSMEDLYFLQALKQQKKLIITELNTIETPTSISVRNGFEQTFGVKWTGWLGRYFSSFDTLKNEGLPKWVVKNYKQQHNNKWPFTKAGIVFVHESDRIEILEKDTHLTDAMPQIYSDPTAQTRYDLPSRIGYSFWFSIILSEANINKVTSHYTIAANAAGLSLLKELNIPQKFPAVIRHEKNGDYTFYYLCGDFCNSTASITSSYFKWIEKFKNILTRLFSSDNADSFFWRFYRPLITNILQQQEKKG